MERVLRLLRHLLFGLGLLVGIVVWFVENPAPTSWVGRTLAPRYAPAITGYRHLTSGSPLSSHDQGFAELLELLTIEAPQMSKGRVAALRLAGLDFVASGNGISIECLDADGHKVDVVRILNPETAIKEHLFEKRIRGVKGVFSFVGLALSAFMYIAEVVVRRRDGAEKTRVKKELAATREELSTLKAQQEPRVLLDTVKRELEWEERRGGPKSPFRQ